MKLFKKIDFHEFCGIMYGVLFILVVIVAVVALVIGLIGAIIDSKNTNYKVIIELPNGEIITGIVSYIEKDKYRTKVNIDNVTYDVANDKITIILEES